MPEPAPVDPVEWAARAASAPLSPTYLADPSAHVFDGRVHVYCSHDVPSAVPFSDSGDHFAMTDYRVLVQDHPEARAADLGPILRLEDVPWADRQLWAPDAAERDGVYHLYFPAKTAAGVFRIGVATSATPTGPFVAEPAPVPGTYSIDPAVFADDDGACYLLFGGLWGGQLQQYRDDVRDPARTVPAPDEPALGPRIARLADDMLTLAEPSREVVILDEAGVPLREGDPRRFFEGSWLHRHGGRYVLSWSTGDSHLVCHGLGDSPYGPFTYAGVVLEPVVGWTTQHSIVRWDDRWFLYYHDAVASGGTTHLRSVKVTELSVAPDGRIAPVRPYGDTAAWPPASLPG